MKILESVYFKNIIQKDHWNHLLFLLCTLIFPVLTKLDASNASPLVIVAEKDERIKPGHTIKMSSLIKDSKLEVVKGAPHFGIVKRKKHMDVVIEHIFNYL